MKKMQYYRFYLDIAVSISPRQDGSPSLYPVELQAQVYFSTLCEHTIFTKQIWTVFGQVRKYYTMKTDIVNIDII